MVTRFGPPWGTRLERLRLTVVFGVRCVHCRAGDKVKKMATPSENKDEGKKRFGAANITVRPAELPTFSVRPTYAGV